jgi:DNA-directed RNA polymerase alpha subunit
MTESTRENLLDTFALEAMKTLIAKRDNDSRDAYRLAGDAYIIAERMLEHRQKVFAQWKLSEEVEQNGIETLNLTVRSERCLKAEGILTIQQLQNCTERRLMKTPNLGRKSITEIIETMAALGYNLRDYT